MCRDGSKIEKIVDEINSKNAKKCAALLVISFAVYHFLLHLKYGGNSCQWLLSDGRYKGDKEWQPFGCMLHHYSGIDTRRCLRYIAYYGHQSHFVFIGDSRIRDISKGFISHLQGSSTTTETSTETNINMTHYDPKLSIKVEFFWAPFITQEVVHFFNKLENLSPHPPSVIVIGSALSAIMKSNGSDNILEEYKINITRLVNPIDKLAKKNVKILWAVQSPINQDKLEPELSAITNSQIDLYNKAAFEVLSFSSAELWWSLRLVGSGLITESLDGMHLSKRSLKHTTQILLNMHCNDYMNFNDGTCCSSMESYTMLQLVTFILLAICVLIAVLMILKRTVQRLRAKAKSDYEYSTLPNEQGHSVTQPENYYILFLALTKISVIMAFFFICDRTNFFMKENKYYSEFSFWLPIGYITVLGLFFMEDSKLTKVLHQDQTNEWKGWMQLVFLVYHVTGAGRILVINMHIKVLISAYLFLLGYEHFWYVWYRGDVGIVRLAKTLFQLNFMTVTLCLCMNRPYQFYHLSPLLSFWYVSIYLFLALPPHVTAQTSDNNYVQYIYLLVKFIIFFSIVTILFMSEVFFEKVFVTRPWKALFVTTDDDIHEWLFRWKLDRYSVLYGMFFAVFLTLGQKFTIYDDNNYFNLFSKRIAISSTLLALFGLGLYTTFTYFCRNEHECSEIHSYVAFIPIVSYVFLRNISGYLRAKYSSFFAWFGKIHLELFLAHYHIWLAADTHGVLVLVPGYPVLNLIITSFIFVCVSHELHQITEELLPFAVPNDWKLVLRNFILFLAILVPIGINDGMF